MMPNDLWYFRESELNKDNIVLFLKGLPNHLQRKFLDSFEIFKNADYDTQNVLQGYRGPFNDGSSGDSEYLGVRNGLQEISYRWGISKQILWLPIAWSIFALARSYQDTNWHSLYFDCKTGECLSHSKNEAAKKLNNKGKQFFQEGKYAEAEECHTNAHEACSAGYEHEQMFKNDRDRAKAESDAANLNSVGEDLFNKGQYSEALRKHQEAFDKSQVRKEYRKYRANREKAQAEIDAMRFNSEGDDLFSKEKYFEALVKYQMACDKSLIRKEYRKYCANREKARAEVDARNLSAEGDNLINKKYSTLGEALEKMCAGLPQIKEEKSCMKKNPVV